MNHETFDLILALDKIVFCSLEVYIFRRLLVQGN